MDLHKGIQGLIPGHPLFSETDVQRALSHMTPSQAVAALTYKPNVQFQLDGNIFLIKASVLDADDPEKFIPIMGHYPLTERDPIRQIVTCIRDLEDHEMREWLRFGGFRLDPPHLGQI